MRLILAAATETLGAMMGGCAAGKRAFQRKELACKVARLHAPGRSGSDGARVSVFNNLQVALPD
jgi:hypothetical protein